MVYTSPPPHTHTHTYTHTHIHTHTLLFRQGTFFDADLVASHPSYLGLAKIIYIRGIYGIFCRVYINYTVIYGAHIRFWPTLLIPHTLIHRVVQNRIYAPCMTVHLVIILPKLPYIYDSGQPYSYVLKPVTYRYASTHVSAHTNTHIHTLISALYSFAAIRRTRNVPGTEPQLVTQQQWLPSCRIWQQH